MDRTLIVCEKPAAAAKVADALAEGKARKGMLKGVPYYRLERGGKPITVVPALGHLFALKNLRPMRAYPFYDIGWVPAYKADRRAVRTKAFISAIGELARGATEYVSACDYDTEGSVIAANVLKHVCGDDALKRARRMKFSTLVPEELRLAYERLSPRLDFEQIDAGTARHFLDWYWGMNISLAMSFAVKAAEKRFTKLSAGRVQTPTLKILADREKEIAAFKPVPFWMLKLFLDVGGSAMVAEHSAGRFWDKEKAAGALAACKGRPAIIFSVHRHAYERPPPLPFNLGGLQSEAYRCFGFSPTRTQQTAQELYQAAFISYPRTDSQKLPPTIGYARIIGLLGEMSAQYKKISDELLASPELRPNEGGRADPAHPSIYPTGEKPEALAGPRKKIFDLIARRFFSVFGRPALVESTKAAINVGGQIFHVGGQKLLDKGWMNFYGPHARQGASPLPLLSEGQELPVKEIRLDEGKTLPPARYNPSSILNEMESKRLGTKGTRAQIIQNLHARGYILGNQIAVTDLGLAVVDALLKHCPEIVSEELTSRFEEELEAIREGKSSKEDVIAEARGELDKILGAFKQHELEIGKQLSEGYRAARAKQYILGKCKCGGDFKVIRSRATQKRFVGCSNYPVCKGSFPLPKFGDIIRLARLANIARPR